MRFPCRLPVVCQFHMGREKDDDYWCESESNTLQWVPGILQSWPLKLENNVTTFVILEVAHCDLLVFEFLFCFRLTFSFRFHFLAFAAETTFEL